MDGVSRAYKSIHWRLLPRSEAEIQVKLKMGKPISIFKSHFVGSDTQKHEKLVDVCWENVYKFAVVLLG